MLSNYNFCIIVLPAVYHIIIYTDMLNDNFIGKQIASRIFYFRGIEFRFGIFDLDFFDILIHFYIENE